MTLRSNHVFEIYAVIHKKLPFVNKEQRNINNINLVLNIIHYLHSDYYPHLLLLLYHYCNYIILLLLLSQRLGRCAL